MVSIDLNPNEFTCFKTNYAKDSTKCPLLQKHCKCRSEKTLT